MPAQIIALISGLIFGLGLALGGMLDPAKIQGFLDIFGAWDATLLFVLCGAVGFTLIAFRLVLRQARPLFAERFNLPARNDVDRNVVIGSALFGIGWGLAGYCPGPALASLAAPSVGIGVFLAAMFAGSIAHRWYEKWRQQTLISSASTAKG